MLVHPLFYLLYDWNFSFVCANLRVEWTERMSELQLRYIHDGIVTSKLLFKDLDGGIVLPEFVHFF